MRWLVPLWICGCVNAAELLWEYPANVQANLVFNIHVMLPNGQYVMAGNLTPKQGVIAEIAGTNVYSAFVDLPVGTNKIAVSANIMGRQSPITWLPCAVPAPIEIAVNGSLQEAVTPTGPWRDISQFSLVTPWASEGRFFRMKAGMATNMLSTPPPLP